MFWCMAPTTPLPLRDRLVSVASVVNLFAPTVCPVCDRPGAAPCASCIATVGAPPLLGPPSGLDRCWSVMSYDATGRRIVAGLKYRNGRAVVRWLGAHLAEAALRFDIDVVTWAPTTRAHRRARGYDQAELLARRVAAEAGLPVRACLVRLAGPSQTGHTLAERRHAPRFDLRRGVTQHCYGRRVALIDDVVTSGATMTAAARLLQVAGAHQVVGLSVARTPLARSRHR